MKPGPFSIGSNTFPGASKLIEETGELQQVLGKLIACGGDAEHHWSGNLRLMLIDEIGDTLAALGFFAKMNMTVEEQRAITRRADEKVTTFERWHEEQR